MWILMIIGLHTDHAEFDDYIIHVKFDDHSHIVHVKFDDYVVHVEFDDHSHTVHVEFDDYSLCGL